jgi:hypothetical protein
MFAIPTQVFKSSQWELRSSLRQPMEALEGISLVGVPKKVVSLSKSAHVSVSSEFILQIKLILSSPNVVLTFYTYKVSNKKVSS